MRDLKIAFLIICCFIANPSYLMAGLDDLDELDQDNQNRDKEKKEAAEQLDYDESLDDEDEKTKPQIQPEKKPEKKISKPKSYISQKRVKTKAEGDKDAGNQPVQIKSKGLRALKNEGILELKENVLITQDNLLLSADYAKVYSGKDEENQIDRIFIRGNVKISKKAERPEDRVVARGEEAVFYNKTRKVILKGKARLWRGNDLIKGKKIDYDMNTGWITVDSAEGIIDPEANLESDR